MFLFYRYAPYLSKALPHMKAAGRGFHSKFYLSGKEHHEMGLEENAVIHFLRKLDAAPFLVNYQGT